MDWHRCRSGCGVLWWKRRGRWIGRGREEEEKEKRKRKRRGRPSPRCARPSRKPGGFRGTLPRATVTTGKKLKSWEGREASNASVPGRARGDTSPVGMYWHRCCSGCGVLWWKRRGREEEEKRKRKRKRKRRGRPSPRCARPSRKPGGFRGTLPRAAVTTGKELKSWEGREASNASVPGRAKADISPVAMDWHRCRSGCGVLWWKRRGRWIGRGREEEEKEKRKRKRRGREREEEDPPLAALDPPGSREGSAAPSHALQSPLAKN
jgi:hypothetical protein